MKGRGAQAMADKSGKLGAKIADTVTRAHISTKMKLMPEYVKLAMAIQEAFFALTGDEHGQTTAGFWKSLIDTGKLTGPALDTAEFLYEGHGQWRTMLAGSATGAAMGGGILDIVVNEFAPAVQAALALNPHKLLAPGDLAGAAARGLIDMGSATHEAAKGGLNEENFLRLYGMSVGVPDPDQLGQLVNRGLLPLDKAKSAARLGGLDTAFLDAVLAMREQLISPGDLASLVTFGVLTEDQAAPIAAKSGTSKDDFHLLVMGNGQPPSTEQLLFAYRRKIIDEARLLRGIKQGPVRDEWFDVLRSLGSIPMSTADAIQASVQGHLSHAQAQLIAEQNGLLSEHFEPLFQTAGSPPGPQAMLTFLRRGFATDPEVRQALSESRLKPKYTDLLMKTRDVLPPMTVIRSGFAHGAITHERAVKLLGEHGYSAENADMILAGGHGEKSATVRHLTVSQVMALYSDRAITRVSAHDTLTALGYDDTDANTLIALADIDRNRKLMAASLHRVHAAYVGRHITAEQASSELDELLVPVDQRDDLLTVWDIERNTVTKGLTLAQTSAAFKKGIIVEDVFRDRIAAMGYSPGDVDILVALAGGGQAAGG